MTDESEVIISGADATSEINSDRGREFLSINRTFLKRCIRLLAIMFPRLLCPTTGLFLLLFILSILDQVVAYFVGILPSKFYKALGSRDLGLFKELAWKAQLLIVAKVLSLATIKFVANLLYLNWRRLICFELHRRYFTGQVFYRLNVMERNSVLDNPDQRITQDVDRMCYFLSDIFWPLTITPFVIAYYTYKTYQGASWVGPVTIYGYFIIGTVVNRLLMNRLVDLNVKKERKEGDFRFKHMQIRQNAESIAFSKSGLTENTLANVSLDQLLAVQAKLINWEYLLQLCTSCFDYTGAILSYWILGFVIFALHAYQHTDPAELASIISKSAFIYMYLIGSFSRLIDLSVKFSTMAGNAHRVAQLLTHMKNVSQNSPDGDSPSKHYQWRDSKDYKGVTGHLLSLDKLSYSVPDSEHTLVDQLTVSVTSGQRVLITGDSSVGKTTLFRVLAGLWEPKSGIIDWHIPVDGIKGVMILPQRAYFTHGSLLQQIVYPLLPNDPQLSDSETLDRKILPLIKLANLEHLLAESGRKSYEWTDVLSPGEMQRLAFVRVLFHKPTLVLLDEATSSLSSSMERKLYAALIGQGIQFCSIGHRDSLKAFHDVEIHFNGQGAWSIGPLSRATSYNSVSDSIGFDHRL